MKTWYDVTLDELTLPEGGYDQKLIDQLDLIEYVEEIDDLVDWGINDDPIPAREQIEGMFMKIFIEANRVLGNAGKTNPDHTIEYLSTKEVKEKIEKILQLSMSVTSETWPDVRQKLLDDAGIKYERNQSSDIDPRFINGVQIL